MAGFRADVGVYQTVDGAVPVLDGVWSRIHAGEVVALLDRSASGESTLSRCIAGLIAPSSGGVTSCGVTVDGPYPSMAMVFQSYVLLPSCAAGTGHALPAGSPVPPGDPLHVLVGVAVMSAYVIAVNRLA
ncbi:MAG: hypothetical protein QM733_21560 [Ilumatobacteraceae bacterium]